MKILWLMSMSLRIWDQPHALRSSNFSDLAYFLVLNIPSLKCALLHAMFWEPNIEAIVNECVWLVDWQMCGDAERVTEKYLQPIITKTLITTRFRINQLIDAKQKRPDDVHGPYWKKLVAMRSTEAAQQRSAHMRSISLSKVSTSAQVKAIERQVVSRLVSMEDGSFLVHFLSLNSSLPFECQRRWCR